MHSQQQPIFPSLYFAYYLFLLFENQFLLQNITYVASIDLLTFQEKISQQEFQLSKPHFVQYLMQKLFFPSQDVLQGLSNPNVANRLISHLIHKNQQESPSIHLYVHNDIQFFHKYLKPNLLHAPNRQLPFQKRCQI